VRFAYDKPFVDIPIPIAIGIPALEEHHDFFYQILE
jgi:hypothetical protein